MSRTREAKRDFATRLAPQTLVQLDALVQHGRFKNRTEAIETAIARLYETERRDPERLRRAFERACGALPGGSDRADLKRAEHDRLDWEYARNTGHLKRPSKVDG